MSKEGNAVHGLQSHLTDIHQLIDAGDPVSLNMARDMLPLLADDMIELVGALRSSQLKSIVVDVVHQDDDPFAQNFTHLVNMNVTAATILFRAIGLDGMYAVRFAVDPATSQIFYYTTPEYVEKLRELRNEVHEIPELLVSSSNL